MNPNPVTRTNYIFVDYENVQDLNLDLITGKPVKLFLVVGNRRKTLPSSLARQMHRYHDQVTWIESEGAGHNSLDLVLAYHVGLQAKADPAGYFHILARDKDYDALIQHLRANNILASRDHEFAKIPVLVAFPRLSLVERVNWVVERFAKSKTTRPKQDKKLLTTIHAFFRKELSEHEVEQVAKAMVATKLIDVGPRGEVVYHL